MFNPEGCDRFFSIFGPRIFFWDIRDPDVGMSGQTFYASGLFCRFRQEMAGMFQARKTHFSLRAKGALISEPRFFTPLRDAISPTRARENGLCRGFFFKKAVFPFSRNKNRISQGVKNRGSLISAPLALRVFFLVSLGSSFQTKPQNPCE